MSSLPAAMVRVSQDMQQLPSGKRLEFAIEHDHRNSEFSHENWWILA